MKSLHSSTNSHSGSAFTTLFAPLLVVSGCETDADEEPDELLADAAHESVHEEELEVGDMVAEAAAIDSDHGLNVRDGAVRDVDQGTRCSCWCSCEGSETPNGCKSSLGTMQIHIEANLPVEGNHQSFIGGVTAPYHAKSQRTGCKKTLVIHQEAGQSWEQASHSVLLRLCAWAICAPDHGRQRDHLWTVVRAEHPPEHIIEGPATCLG